MRRRPFLLDVKVLIALAWPSHVHHELAHTWFGRMARHGWATCPTTESGFVRVSSNPAAVGETGLPVHALELLRRITAVAGHIFWPEDAPFAASVYLDGRGLLGHKQVTDAYLLGLARRHGGKLATLDGHLAALAADRAAAEQLLEIIGAEVTPGDTAR